MNLSKKYHQKTPKNRTDLLKKKRAIIKSSSGSETDLSEAGGTHPLSQGLRNIKSWYSHMLGRCGEDQFTAKTMRVSLGETEPLGVLSNLVHCNIQTCKMVFFVVWFSLCPFNVVNF